MEKRDLKSWTAVLTHAHQRGFRSLKRKDPIAYAYWKETAAYAHRMAGAVSTREEFIVQARRCVAFARTCMDRKDFMQGALWYSRAKWNVIVARAKGFVMNPKETGVNLKWLEDRERIFMGEAV